MLRRLALVSSLVPLSAQADDLVDRPDPQAIYGGEPVAACGWPSTAFVSDCTGTLVHPEVVIYASHCGSAVSEVFFGDAIDSPGITIPTEFCRAHTETQGTDWAFCKLSQPATGIPITPPLMGCETELLQPGLPVWIVGFGEIEGGGYGSKYQAQATLHQLEGGEAFIGGAAEGDTCYGDSGGPAFVQLDDGSWRAFGITSYAEVEECGMGTWFSMMHTGMDWFESESGVDLTPCHDADGTWNPTAACTGFPTAPMTGGGAWPDACDAGPTSGASASCGPAFGGGDDTTAPVVAITTPSDGTRVPDDGSGGATVHVTIAADDDSGVAEVAVVVDGVTSGAALTAAPYELDVVLADGEHTISAHATDVAGNVGDATPVVVHVGDDVGETTGSGEDDGTGGGDETSGGHAGGDDAAMDDAAAGGCGCASAPAGSGFAVLGWLALVRRRRARGNPRSTSR